MAIKVLVIDDDLDILDALKDLLELEGYSVETTPRAEETLPKAERYQPDVIILDVLLSGTDGRFLAQLLRKKRKTHHIPIIMISAHPSAAKTAQASGANDFLAKPFEMDTLLTTLARHCR